MDDLIARLMAGTQSDIEQIETNWSDYGKDNDANGQH